METVKRNKVSSLVILVLLLVIFAGMFAAYGPGIYNDSDQYISMHIHREPLYPLFLLLLRTIFGAGWLTAAGLLQGALAAVSIWLSAEYFRRKFSLYLWEELVVAGLQLCPYFMTIFFSVTGLFIPNSIMSEALCLPFFMLFIMECFKMFTEEGKACQKAALLALLLALLMSLTRSQMMASLLVWMIVLGTRVLVRKADWRKKLLRLCGVAAIVLFVFAVRLLAVKSYNLVFNGHFINNTYGGVNTLTNILYASDREDGEHIKDEEARQFFYIMQDALEERHAGYRYAGESWTEKIAHLEEWHDTIKFEMIEDLFYQTYTKTIANDYIIVNLKADETSTKIIAGILPQCFGRWFANYLMLAGYGLIRSIAVVHPVINWIAGLLYLLAIGMALLLIRKNRKAGEKVADAVWLMGLALLAILGNVFTVAVTIMPLSRYMIYGFAPFYIACFVLVISWYRRWQEKRTKKGRKTWAIKI